MALVFNQTPRNSNQELELRFLRHLAYRASHENGKYLSERDKVALARLSEAHCQDTSTTSVEDLAVGEYEMLNSKTEVQFTNNTPMTVGELKMLLDDISDDSTPVYLESGEPVHYTSHGMNQNETRFFIGIM